jgi:hypothetical protein
MVFAKNSNSENQKLILEPILVIQLVQYRSTLQFSLSTYNQEERSVDFANTLLPDPDDV